MGGVCLNKPSDVLDTLDKAADIGNFWLDIRRQILIDEIQWIDANYENTASLRKYLLECAGFDNVVANISYAKRLNSYSDKQIQKIVAARANVLYQRILRIENNKVDNKPLKLIVQELKLSNR